MSNTLILPIYCLGLRFCRFPGVCRSVLSNYHRKMQNDSLTFPHFCGIIYSESIWKEDAFLTTVLMSAILIVGLTVTGGVILTLLMDPRDQSLREFAVLGLFCSVIMMLSYYTELNNPGFAAKVDAVKFGYIGRVFVNPVLLMLVIRYYGAKVSRLTQSCMLLIPVVTLYLVFTCEKNRLYYANITLSPEGILHITPGPFYYAYMAYNTVLALIYITFCLYERAWLRGRDRTNNTLLLLACMVPFFFLLIYLSGWTNGYDVSSVGVMIGALLIALSILRYGLLNKDEMLQSMATGLVFLDNDSRLVYANRAAAQLIPALNLSYFKAHQLDLSQLCGEQFAALQVNGKTYQRKITEWSSGDGQHGTLLTFDDITEIRARLNCDAMTGLLNHATFYPMLDEAMAAANANHTSVTVSIADIDSFKRINDNFGHANGDIILISLANILQKVCGQHGDVFRYGGEEFAVIFYGGMQLAELTMQKALTQFSALNFDFLPYHVSFSYGSAEFDGKETSVILFDRADQLMYTRKRALHAREEAEAAAAAAAEETESAQDSAAEQTDSAQTVSAQS